MSSYNELDFSGLGFLNPQEKNVGLILRACIKKTAVTHNTNKSDKLQFIQVYNSWNKFPMHNVAGNSTNCLHCAGLHAFHSPMIGIIPIIHILPHWQRWALLIYYCHQERINLCVGLQVFCVQTLAACTELTTPQIESWSASNGWLNPHYE